MNKYEEMVAGLTARREESKKQPKVSNNDLPAGAPMHYYCNLCWALTDVLPEDHEESPRRYCGSCQQMVDAGWSDVEQSFIIYERQTCPSCGGSGLGVYDYYLKRRRRCSNCNGSCTVRHRVDMIPKVPFTADQR